MSIWIEINLSIQSMYCLIILLHKRSNTARHNVDDGMFNPFFFNNLYTLVQSFAVIINSLSWTKLLRHMNFEAIRIVINKTRTRDDLGIHLCFVHMTLTIGFDCHMILNIFIILMILSQLVYKCLVSSVSSKAFCANEEYMLFFCHLLNSPSFNI